MVRCAGTNGAGRRANLVPWILAFLGFAPTLDHSQADEPPNPAAADVAFFESRVRPVLIEKCQGCHGPEKQKGGLRLDGRDAVMRGGDSGSALDPEQPEEGLLFRAVSYQDDLKMPPKGKLRDDEIAAIRRWVAKGAPWPGNRPIAEKARADPPQPQADGTGFREEERAFWAFQPPASPPVPSVKRTEWTRTPIDAFILSKLEANHLSPAPSADPRTLIRRVTFDLIGLPPTPEETAAFLADPSPDAYPRLVERLLASPHYGERWGRHWLDVARYADSNGMDENLAFAHAWRYRDYVVEAFNRDLPFDAFIREQIAGDVLPPSGNAARDRQRLAATGFLVLGPKMLAEDDPMKMEMDIVDEQVDSVGKAFLGLTLGCARCHDHKFDPIRMSDYYGLAGIFKSTRTMEHYRVVAHWNERPLADPSEAADLERAREQIKKKKAEIDQAVSRANEAILAAMRGDGSKHEPKLPEKPENLYPEAVKASLARLRGELSKLEAACPKYPTAMAVSEREAVDLPIHIRGSHLTLGQVVPRSFPAVLRGQDPPKIGKDRSGRLDLAVWLARPDNPLTARVIANRVWLWHFGEGLVRSVDNFGRLGERPTHPELLDWLATRLVAGGWSLKGLHRDIVLSSTYQMSTAANPQAAATDPENHLLSHRSRRRLEAEEVRDTILMASGQLDRSMGGSLLRSGNREYVAGTASVNSTNYQSLRRSIYLPVIRSALYEVFQAFDFADPSTGAGRRDTTTVAPQALCLMNSELVQQASESMAETLRREAGPDEGSMLRRAYAKTLGRAPNADELARARSFMDAYEKALASEPQPEGPRDTRQAAWQAFCRVLLGTSELIFVD